MFINRIKKYPVSLSIALSVIMVVSAIIITSCGTGIDSGGPGNGRKIGAAGTAYYALIASTGDNKVYSYGLNANTGALTGSLITSLTVTAASSIALNSDGTCGFALTTAGKVQAFTIGTDGSLTAVGALTAVVTASPGRIIVDNANAFVYVSGTTDGKIYMAALTNSSCALGAFNGGVAVTQGGTALYPNGMEFASSTKMFTVGTENGGNAGSAGLAVLTVNAGTGAITAASPSFFATTSGDATDNPSLIALDTGLLRAYVMNNNAVGNTAVNIYTTTATTVTATAQAAGYQPAGTNCTGFAKSGDATMAVLLCTAGTKDLTSYTVSTGLTKKSTVSIASLASGGQVAFVPGTINGKYIVLASDNAGAAGGKVFAYQLDGTAGTFSALNSLTGFTNPAGIAVVSK